MLDPDSWHVSPLANTLLRHIQDLGYLLVSVHHNPGSLRRSVGPFLELSAFTVGGERETVRVFVEDGVDAGYVGAVKLAEAVGIDLE